jgi:uncharacterized protein (TIGR03083 family)
MTDSELTDSLDRALEALGQVAGHDWTLPAGSLDWSCWQAIDHTIDCVLSFALQIGQPMDSGFHPLAPIHAEPTATPSDLVQGLRAVTSLFFAITRVSPQDLTASDGIVSLTIADWRARTAYEVVLHTYDVRAGLGQDFSLPDALSTSIMAGGALWMFDRSRAQRASDPWHALITGSGR